jgi:formate hydrogenlyase subunit 4
MIKYLIILISLFLIILRSFFIYKIAFWLVNNLNVENVNLTQISWVLVAIVLDMYLLSIQKSYEVYIYKENQDEQEGNQ